MPWPWSPFGNLESSLASQLAGDLLWVWGGGGSAASGWGSVYPKKRGAVVMSGEAQESRILVCHLFPVSHPPPFSHLKSRLWGMLVLKVTEPGLGLRRTSLRWTIWELVVSEYGIGSSHEDPGANEY